MQFNFNSLMIVVFILIYIAIIFSFMYLAKKIKYKLSKKVKKVFHIIFWTSFLVIQVTYAYLICRNIGFDCGVLFGNAVNLAENKPLDIAYFSMYGNNLFLLLAFEVIFTIAKWLHLKSYLFLSVLINLVIIDIAIWYVYLVCKKLISKKYQYLSYFFTIPMLGITPVIAVVYSDTLSLMFPIAIFYHYLCLKQDKNTRNKKILHLALIAFLITIGILIKPTNIIIAIAIGMIEIVSLLGNWIKNRKQITWKNTFTKEKVKNMCIYFFTFVMVVIVLYGGFSVYKTFRLEGENITKEMIEARSFPMTHFLMMGLKPVDFEGTYYGAYNIDDAKKTESLIGKQAKTEYHLEQIKQRITNMGFNGYLSYLYDKFTWIISDGTFFYGLEGNFYSDDRIKTGKLASKVQEYTYLYNEGYQKVTCNIMQAFWLMTLIFGFVGTILDMKNKELKSQDVLRLGCIGIILFILMFEARSRYLINYLPIFITLSIYGIVSLVQKITVEK